MPNFLQTDLQISPHVATGDAFSLALGSLRIRLVLAQCMAHSWHEASEATADSVAALLQALTESATAEASVRAPAVYAAE